MTLSVQIEKPRQRSKLQRAAMVADRGALIGRADREVHRARAGLDWIETAPRAPADQVQSRRRRWPPGPRCSITATWPNHQPRLSGRTPVSPQPVARRRAGLENGAESLPVTENELARIAARVQRARSPLRGASAIGQAALGAALGRRHLAKHFQISIADDAFSSCPISSQHRRRGRCSTASTANRTKLPATQSDAAATVRAYNVSGASSTPPARRTPSISEPASWCSHWTAPRVLRACLLAACLPIICKWHMVLVASPTCVWRARSGRVRVAHRTPPAAKAEPSPAVQRKAARERTDPADGDALRVNSGFNTLLGDPRHARPATS